MTDIQIVLLVVFVVSTLVGYFLINKVPSLLHTPLMSGMNALSGVTILGAIVAAALAIEANSEILAYVLGGLAIILATINLVGGFALTERMLKKFIRGKNHD